MQRFNRFALSVCACLGLVFIGLGADTQSVSAQSATEQYLCPKFGKMHSRVAGQQMVVEGSQPVYSSMRPSLEGASNVLDMLNSQRARQRLSSLRYDPQLQAVAERRAQQMAASGQKGHPPGSFAPGTHEGVGWSSSFSPSGVSACYTSDPRMQYAGAAMARGRDGVYFAVVYR
jgi:hypothetical protein